MMINVEFNGGQGRKTDTAVNYMLAEVDGIELYAEMEIPEDANPDEYGYDELKDEIIAQAKENDIDTSLLKFWWD
jgi:Tfp pilus assembly protein FimV